MGEVVAMADYDGRVLDWSAGLPCADDLTPLSQALVPPRLATAFNIRPEPSRTTVDVDRASRETVSGLQGGQVPAFVENSFKPFDEKNRPGDTAVDEEGDERSDSRKIRRIEAAEEADSASRGEYSNSIDDPSAKALKRPRLVWTPQLHRRFVDVVTHLGIRNAVPKTIMQLMNVEGLTRENVASHLQKYRLYVKRSNDGPNSSSDQLFASVQPPQSSNLHHGARSGHLAMPVAVPMPYSSAMVPVPMFGIGSRVGMDHHAYGMMQHRDRSGNSNGSVVSYPHVAPIEK